MPNELGLILFLSIMIFWFLSIFNFLFFVNSDGINIPEELSII